MMGGASPVLALRALELAVQAAAARPAGGRRGGGASLSVQVEGGASGALLQVDALRAPLVTHVGRHEQRAGERRLRRRRHKEEEEEET
ncbi:hypothetical protein EYF80_054442 [Liparis tanakae]|uniref:Uncharacterized protein n=1 Tax=Liparis tanakae TaxID=230148 RepID=A0A4Z2F2E4_9TELE|nr:hypothetical protein EYF80_054442 [Liparis tanakae]